MPKCFGEGKMEERRTGVRDGDRGTGLQGREGGRLDLFPKLFLSASERVWVITPGMSL